MENIDDQIVYRLQQGDTAAFDLLYWQYSRTIYLNALQLIKDRHVAEDIVQEVFITLWEKRSTIDPERPILNWIFVISYHKSVDHLKKSLRNSLLYDQFAGDLVLMGKEDTHPRERQLNLIEKAIQELSPQKRRVFELCKLKGFSYENAADQMHISKHTVKEYLTGAMKNIRDFVRTVANP